MLRSQVGGYFVAPWSLFRATQVYQNGLWCQVSSESNAGMGSNIGDMFYSTGDGPDGFTVVPTSDPSNNVSYQQLKCTNQIGVIVDGTINTTYFQGFLKCNTTIPNLDINTHFWVMYSDTVFYGYCKKLLKYACVHELQLIVILTKFNSIVLLFFHFVAGPTVDPNMTLSILSSRDTDDIHIAFSFTVSYGPPSTIICRRNNVQLLYIRGPNSRLTREVIRSRYINSTQPDMTRVTVRPGLQPRVGATYTCTVTVESRINIDSGVYDFDEKGMGSTTATVTGE